MEQHERYTNPRPRMKWPFRKMQLLEQVTYDMQEDYALAKKAQAAAHNYGRSVGKEFETYTLDKQGEHIKKVMVITRVM